MVASVDVKTTRAKIFLNLYSYNPREKMTKQKMSTYLKHVEIVKF